MRLVNGTYFSDFELELTAVMQSNAIFIVGKDLFSLEDLK